MSRAWRTAPGLRLGAIVVVLITALGACGVDQGPATPTPVPTPSPADAERVARSYLAAWTAGNYQAMWTLVAPEDQRLTTYDRFAALHKQFATLVGVTKLTATAKPGQPTRLLLPTPSVSSSQSPTSRGASPRESEASPQQSTGPGGSTPAVPPSVPAIGVPVTLDFTTNIFGDLPLQRLLMLTAGAKGFVVRWSRALLFPELGMDGTFTLSRAASPRGRIVAADGTVFATTRADGMRVYPQESLAGQTIGYVTRVTSTDLKTLAAKGYRAGDWVGRSGLELGAEDLLRGKPGFTLSAVVPGRAPITVLDTPMVPGATLTISIRPALQRAAEAAMRRYPRVASAVVDPRSGEVLALASLPSFDPNAMTLGTTLHGVGLARPGKEQILNKAVMGAYPAGSDFKPFTLGAALQSRTVTTTTTMLCPGTWTYDGFTFKNWMRESLGGLRPWVDTMALSCNTTYMPLSVLVYQRNKTALTDLLHDFGFGQPTGMDFLAEDPGVLPDAAYFKTHKRWNGKLSPYGPFDQIQLAIGQGEYKGTALQLALAYAAWGNRGTLWEPRLVLKAVRPSGVTVYRSKPTVHHAIGLSKPVMDFVVTTMRAVITSPLGTAHGAFFGFPIAAAGKSGTAETGGPDPDAWFPAFAPMTRPTIAVATVVVTVPLGTGGDFAAPITRRIMEAYFFG
jgi:cell division protein FtsI/penicillin-binding protein 2